MIHYTSRIVFQPNEAEHYKEDTGQQPVSSDMLNLYGQLSKNCDRILLISQMSLITFCAHMKPNTARTTHIGLAQASSHHDMQEYVLAESNQ